jgi:hypothetical protein
MKTRLLKWIILLYRSQTTEFEYSETNFHELKSSKQESKGLKITRDFVLTLCFKAPRLVLGIFEVRYKKSLIYIYIYSTYNHDKKSPDTCCIIELVGNTTEEKCCFRCWELTHSRSAPVLNTNFTERSRHKSKNVRRFVTEYCAKWNECYTALQNPSNNWKSVRKTCRWF